MNFSKFWVSLRKNTHLAESKNYLFSRYIINAAHVKKKKGYRKKKEKKPLKRKKTSEKKVVNRIPIFLPFLMYPYFPCVRRLYWEKMPNDSLSLRILSLPTMWYFVSRRCFSPQLIANQKKSDKFEKLSPPTSTRKKIWRFNIYSLNYRRKNTNDMITKSWMILT